MIEPRYKSDRVELYCADCLDVLPQLEAGSVDAVVTDPPYGIGFSSATWADKPEEYPQFIRQIINHSNRLTHGPKAYWQALPNINRWGDWFDFDYRMIAICKGFVQYRPTPLQWSFDPVIVWGNINKEPSVYHKDYYFQAKAPFGAHRERIDHPSPRPLEAMIYLVNILTNQNDIILDPFAGSGTTGVAAMQTGRRFIGIEIDPTYYAIAERRIRASERQLLLGI